MRCKDMYVLTCRINKCWPSHVCSVFGRSANDAECQRFSCAAMHKAVFTCLDAKEDIKGSIRGIELEGTCTFELESDSARTFLRFRVERS